MPAQATAPITGPWAFVGGFVSSLFGGRGKSYREALAERGPIQVPPAFRVPDEPGPQIPTLPTIVVTAPRPPISRTGSIGRYFKRVKKKLRSLTKEQRELLEFVGDYYANNYMPMPTGLKRGSMKPSRNDARAGKSKQRGFVSPAPTKIVPGSIGYSDTPFKMRHYPPPPAPAPQPVKPRRAPRTTTQAMPRVPLPIFRPEELPPLPNEMQPQRQAQRVPARQPGTKQDTAPYSWEGPEVILRIPQRAPAPARKPKAVPKAPAPAKTASKVPSWALSPALQLLLPRAPQLGRAAATLRRVPELSRARVPTIGTAPMLQIPGAVGVATTRTGKRSSSGECECPKPKRKPRQPRRVCYEGRFKESSFSTSKSQRKEIPCQ